MSGESANIATAGSSRSKPLTNSALVNGAENQLKRKYKYYPNHSWIWIYNRMQQLIRISKRLLEYQMKGSDET